MKHNNKPLLISLGLAQVFDGLLTYLGLTYHIAQEGNPVVRTFIDSLGLVMGLVTVKSLALILLVLLSFSPGTRKLTKALVAVSLLYWTVIGSWVIILLWNLDKILS